MEFNIEQITHVNEYNINTPHAHDYFEVFLFQTGGGKHLIDFQEINIEPNSIHIVLPGQVHQIERQGSCVGMVMMFSETYLASDLNLLKTIHQFPFQSLRKKALSKSLNSTEFTFLYDFVANIFNENNANGFNSKTIISSYLNILLLKIQEVFADQKIKYSDDIVQLFKLIEANFISRPKLGWIAEKLNTTENSLHKRVQDETGKSYQQLLQNKLILEAKKMLIYTQKSNKEIAYDLNFTDPSHFNKFFKKHNSITPNEFRNSNEGDLSKS